MDKTACMKMIGDCIAEIDTLRGSFSEGTKERMELDEKRHRLSEKQASLAVLIFNQGTAEYKAATKKLAAVNGQVETTIKNVNKIAGTLASLTQFSAAVDELLKLALPSIDSLSAITTIARDSFAMKKSIPFDELEKVLRYRGEALESAATQPVSPVKGEAHLLPIEEVLHGVELTPEKLIITVATGGCTGEDSFHVEVNKGYTGLPPYLVTVYRIVPDDCKGAFEPMKIAFSRENLGLDGLVEFILRNKIGNTSQHRLDS